LVWFKAEWGCHELKGEWPLVHFQPKIEASTDPITWLRMLCVGQRSGDGLGCASKITFCPDVHSALFGRLCLVQ